MEQVDDDKIYVQVEAFFDINGEVVPKSIIWENGKIYTIDKILDVRNACSLHSGGSGTRYTIKIGGNVRYLFCEGQNVLSHHEFCRWFISKEGY